MLIDVVDQLCTAGILDEAGISYFHQEWDVAQQLEILALVGTYTTISLVANVAALAPEAFAARFPT